MGNRQSYFRLRGVQANVKGKFLGRDSDLSIRAGVIPHRSVTLGLTIGSSDRGVASLVSQGVRR
jgi:hypothetical protein